MPQPVAILFDDAEIAAAGETVAGQGIILPPPAEAVAVERADDREEDRRAARPDGRIAIP